MAHWRARSPKLGLGGLSKPERTWNTSFTHVLGQPYLSIPFPLPHYTTMPPLMKPLGMKLLYSEHGVLKRNNSFINHTKQSRNISGGSAAIFLLIYAVRAQISSGTVLIHLPKLKENSLPTLPRDSISHYVRYSETSDFPNHKCCSTKLFIEGPLSTR